MSCTNHEMNRCYLKPLAFLVYIFSRHALDTEMRPLFEP